MKTVIWDLDGTLVDSYPHIVEALMVFTKRYGLMYEESEILFRLKTESSKEFFEELSNKTMKSVEDLKTEYQVLFDEYEGDIQLIKGAKEILHVLKKAGVVHHIYTHKGKTTIDVLKQTAIDSYFNDIVTSENNFKRKPDGDALNYLVNKYKLNKKDTYYVGDRLLDVLSANDAGIKSVFFNEDGLTFTESNYTIQNLLELQNIVL